MYPQPTNFSPAPSNPPKPSSIFQPNSVDQSTESSPQSSPPCGQRTPAASTSSSDAPPSHSQTPLQLFVHPQHQPRIPTPTQHTSPKPQKQQIQQTPVKSNANKPSQPSISEEDQQHVPKSTNGSQVKCSKQPQQDECLCFHCNQPGHLKRNCPKIPYYSKCRTRGHAQDRCTNNPQRTRHMRQPGQSRDQQKGTKISHSFQTATIGVYGVQEIISLRIVHENDKLQPLTVLLVVQVLHYTKMHLTPHIHLFILTHNHQPHTVSLPCMYKHQLLT